MRSSIACSPSASSASDRRFLKLDCISDSVSDYCGGESRSLSRTYVRALIASLRQ
jgi:hypothetical protein